jgi:hypothetical protein
LRDFGEFDRQLPIFAFTSHEVRPDIVHPRHDGVDIDFSVDVPDRAMIPLDMLIDASGFGEEANPHELADYSYWEAGHRLIYDHLVTPAKVLISGCGDSGVIEGLHYALDEFRHEYVTGLWRYGGGLEAQIDEGLKYARLDAIFACGEGARYDDAVLSAIIWWLDQRWFMAFNKVAWPPGGEVHLPPAAAGVAFVCNLKPSQPRCACISSPRRKKAPRHAARGSYRVMPSASSHSAFGQLPPYLVTARIRLGRSFDRAERCSGSGHAGERSRRTWVVSAGLLRGAEALKAVAAMAARPSAAVLVGTYIHLWPGPPPDCPPAPGRARASPPRSSSDPETLS